MIIATLQNNTSLIST